MKLRHHRLAWSLTLAIVVLVILAALYLASLHYKVEKLFELHRAEIKTLLEDIPVRSSSRPIVLGPAEEGNAWDLLRPALDAVGNLYPLESGLSYDLRDANLDWRGVVGDTPRWIELATPSLEQCRRAMHRSTLIWVGQLDADLPAKAARIGRTLCTKAAYAWQAGREAEGVEWLAVAIAVAQDAARLGQDGTWESLCAVEQWACQEARAHLAEHAFTTPQLEEFGRLLDLLRSIRPAYALHLRNYGATLRAEVLNAQLYVVLDSDRIPLDHTAGWRDLFSTRFLRARVLNGIRDGIERLCELDGGPTARLQVSGILSRYSSRDVRQVLPTDCRDERIRLLEVCRFAVEVARIHAATGRFPVASSDVVLPTEFPRPVIVEDGCVDAQIGDPDVELLWKIRRRSSD